VQDVLIVLIAIVAQLAWSNLMEFAVIDAIVV
jgi:hypothetical protein